MFFLQMRESLSHNSHPQAVPQKFFLKSVFMYLQTSKLQWCMQKINKIERERCVFSSWRICI